MEKKTVLTLICDGCGAPIFINDFHEEMLSRTREIHCVRCSHIHRDRVDLFKLTMYSKLTRSYQ